MQRLRVLSFPMSLDGFAAGPAQSLENPLGVRGTELHEWVFHTRVGREMIGETGGDEGVDNDGIAAGFDGIGATVMGRNMFGPSRGPWTDDGWTGWWGPNPPYHTDVFVLTHHPREAIAMEGGTTFHFVTEGLGVAVQRAMAAAGGLDVRLGGGVATVREALRAGLVDELHVPVVPIFLGDGEALFDDMADVMSAYTTHVVPGERVVHYRFVRS